MQALCEAELSFLDDGLSAHCCGLDAGHDGLHRCERAACGHEWETGDPPYSLESERLAERRRT
jgi:hypothetical protein